MQPLTFSRLRLGCRRPGASHPRAPRAARAAADGARFPLPSHRFWFQPGSWAPFPLVPPGLQIHQCKSSLWFLALSLTSFWCKCVSFLPASPLGLLFCLCLAAPRGRPALGSRPPFAQPPSPRAHAVAEESDFQDLSLISKGKWARRGRTRAWKQTWHTRCACGCAGLRAGSGSRRASGPPRQREPPRLTAAAPGCAAGGFSLGKRQGEEPGSTAPPRPADPRGTPPDPPGPIPAAEGEPRPRPPRAPRSPGRAPRRSAAPARRSGEPRPPPGPRPFPFCPQQHPGLLGAAPGS